MLHQEGAQARVLGRGSVRRAGSIRSTDNVGSTSELAAGGEFRIVIRYSHRAFSLLSRRPSVPAGRQRMLRALRETAGPSRCRTGAPGRRTPDDPRRCLDQTQVGAGARRARWPFRAQFVDRRRGGRDAPVVEGCRPASREENVVRCELDANPPLAGSVNDAVPRLVLENVSAENPSPERTLGM